MCMYVSVPKTLSTVLSLLNVGCHKVVQKSGGQSVHHAPAPAQPLVTPSSLPRHQILLQCCCRVGNYSLTVTVFAPKNAVDLQWQLPGSSTMQAITELFYIGTQPTTARQLLERTVIRSAVHAATAAQQTAANAATLPSLAYLKSVAGLSAALGFIVSFDTAIGPPFRTVLPPLYSVTFPMQAVLPAVNYSTPRAFAQALFGGNPTSESVYGVIDGWIDLGMLGLPAAVFKLSCDACTLLIDDVPVVGALSNTLRTSPCVILGTPAAAASSSDRLVKMKITFTTDALSASVMNVQYDACPGGSSTGLKYLDTAAAPAGIVLPVSAVAESTFRHGFVCNTRTVAQPPVAASNGTVATAQTALSKSQMQGMMAFVSATAANATGGSTTAAARSSTTLQIMPEQLARDMVRKSPAGSLFDVSCWTYWNGSMSSNASIDNAPSGVGVATMYVAGIKVDGAKLHYSTTAIRLATADWGVLINKGVSRSLYTVNPAAYMTSSSMLRLLVLEWRAVLGSSILSVSDEQGPWMLQQQDLWVPSHTAQAAAVQLTAVALGTPVAQ